MTEMTTDQAFELVERMEAATRMMADAAWKIEEAAKTQLRAAEMIARAAREMPHTVRMRP